MATIKDVAKATGLGVGTISRYLNGAQIKETNRVRIEEAIASLGYERNTLARSMKTGRSMTIAVVVPALSNMFSMRVIESIERVLEGQEYSVIVADCGADKRKQLEKLNLLKNKMVDGFVLMPIGDEGAEILTAVQHTPVVLIDRVLTDVSLDSVTVNNREAAREAMMQALRKPVASVGIIEGPKTVSTARERQKGFEEAMALYPQVARHSVKGNYTFEDGCIGAKALIEKGVDLIFSSNYELTVGAVNAIAASGKSVRLVGFDSVEWGYAAGERCTFLSQPVEEIGARAANLLLARIAEPNKEVERIVLEITS